MKNDKKKFKTEFKRRIYFWILKLIEFVGSLSKDFSSQVIGRQLLRSGTSLGANYLEAQAGASKKDFTNFLHHSLKSANESKFWLALLRDSKKAEKDKVDPLLNELIFAPRNIEARKPACRQGRDGRHRLYGNPSTFRGKDVIEIANILGSSLLTVKGRKK